ncbi:hypothetical protein CW711_01290 [Candidatus Bathyarchaeota archaeon]|nr:MAG: hypothetical protein CW711_01290 [Candidatus Bathyarchaeota archaeon]
MQIWRPHDHGMFKLWLYFMSISDVYLVTVTVISIVPPDARGKALVYLNEMMVKIEAKAIVLRLLS